MHLLTDVSTHSVARHDRGYTRHDRRTRLPSVAKHDRRSYEESIQQLTNPQKLLLIAIAKDIKAKEITSSDFVRRHGLKSSSSVQSAANSLYEADTITREADTYFVTNRFLGFWLMERYGVGFRF